MQREIKAAQRRAQRHAEAARKPRVADQPALAAPFAQMTVLPAGRPPDPDLLRRLAEDPVAGLMRAGPPAFHDVERLLAVSQDLNGDGHDEVVLFAERTGGLVRGTLYWREPADAGPWRSADLLSGAGPGPGQAPLTFDKVIAAFEAGEFGPRPPRWPDLGVGPLRYRLPWSYCVIDESVFRCVASRRDSVATEV